MNKSCKPCCMKERLRKSNPDAYANSKNQHISIKDVYPGMEVKKLECVGHHITV